MLENIGGFIVPVQNSNILFEKMNDIFSVDTRKKMSLWNVNKVKQFYTISSVFEKLFAVYEEILNETNN